MDAFKELNWDETIKIILDQWQHLKEVHRRFPEAMVEREISNTINKVIFDNANLRSTVSDALLVMNKEIKRKMRNSAIWTNREIKSGPIICRMRIW